MPARRPLKKPLMTEKMRKKRLAFCKEFKKWTENEWKAVMFSGGELTFRQFGSAKQYMRHPSGESFVHNYRNKTPTSNYDVGMFFFKGRRWTQFLLKGETITVCFRNGVELCINKRWAVLSSSNQQYTILCIWKC